MSRGGPGRVVEDYWEGIRKHDSARFCSAVVIASGGEAVGMPREVCVKAFKRGAPKNVDTYGAFKRVVSTKVRGKKATVTFVAASKGAEKTRHQSVVKTPRGWKVPLGE